MKKNGRRVQIITCAAVLAAAWTAAAATTVLAPVADTFINARFPENNAGGHTWFDAGTDRLMGVRRGLLRFDLSSIPAGSVVTSAVLNLQVAVVPPGGFPSSFSLHRVTAPWNEGNKVGNNGTLATAGEANWNARMHLQANWASPGALGDVVPSGSATAAVDSVIGSRPNWAGPGLIEDLRFWMTNAAGNFGWLLVCNAESSSSSVLGFASHEAGAAGPSLTISYTAAQPTNSPPFISLTAPTNGASFVTPATVTIEAAAGDTDGTVTNVQFFDGASLLGNVTTEPYRITVGLFPGTHVFTAAATDNQGATTLSGAVTNSIVSLAITNPIAARVPKGDITIELQTIADGMASPLGMAVPDDGTGRMFVYDQDGRVWVVTGGNRLTTPLLDVNSRLVPLGAYDERGLLGLATHPDFAQNPLIYTYTSEPTNGFADFQTGVTNNHQSVIAEWRISASNSNTVDAASRREILRIDQPQSNHNGGTMRFGPDGFLYVALGDGGQANDTGLGHVSGGNAQNTNVILGKMIRIDVAGNNSANGSYGIPASNPFVGAGGLPEIYAYGFRNPFSFSFDRVGGALYLADVGQNRVEEVNIVTAGGNYGWNLREASFWFDPTAGTVVTSPVRPPPPNLIDPIAQYDHDDGLAVIGGYVYRGSALGALAGRYVFADWGSFGSPSGRLFYLDSNNLVTELRIGLEDRALGLWVKGIGEGADGELYVFASRWLGPSGNTGRMLKLVPAPAPIQLTGVTAAGGNVGVSWSGGAGPYLVEQKVSIDEPNWAHTEVTTQRSSASAQSSSSGFFRVVDAAHLPRIPLTAYLSGAAEHPPTSSTGTGLGIFALDGNTLTFNVSYSGLTGPATMGHIHGPANTAGDGPPIINLEPFNGGSWGATGTISGVLVLTDAQKAMLLAGRAYVNLHTANFGSGEIRGQIAPANMQVSLSGANEVGAVNTAGRGLGNLLLVGNQLTFNISYAGLSGVANASHIHGPATPSQNAGVITNLAAFNGGEYGTAGTLAGALELAPTALGALIDGLTYVNIHTPSNTTGEIRGQILPQAGAVPFSTVLSGLAVRPTPLTNTASGTGTLSLEGNRLSFNFRYEGLSGNATLAHIHGPASTTSNAGVLIDLAPFNGGGFGTSGAISGAVELSPGQRNLVLNGQTYINFHTAAHPAGEMRGQVAPVVMTSGLNGVNERPVAVRTPGKGAGTFALVRNQITMTVNYADLLSPATASHLHGPAGLTGSAGVLVGLDALNGGGYGTSGGLSGSVTLPYTTLLHVIDGLAYLNFHTTNNPSGEVRGQLMR